MRPVVDADGALILFSPRALEKIAYRNLGAWRGASKVNRIVPLVKPKAFALCPRAIAIDVGLFALILYNNV